jgi:hypothetical protein
MHPRKLEAEAWRDALLAVSGELDGTVGGVPEDDVLASRRRTLYGRISRTGDVFATDAFLRLFDFPAAVATAEQRVTSTVPQGEGGRKPAVTSALKPGEMIAPEWPFAKLVSHAEAGALPAAGKVETRRELAAYIISPENERFAQVVANRVWKRYMGVGIVEPADDWSRGKASHPELLAYLGTEFMRSGYDMKHLARLVRY